MRSYGTVTSVAQLGPSDHLCWPHHDGDDFRARALEFLAEGVARGHRITYIGPASTDELLTDLLALDDAEELIERGAAAVVSTSEMYRSDTVIRPEAQVRAYAAATRRAVAEGFTGLRVAAEATELVRTAEQRDTFVRYEHLIDRAMRSMPFSAMCGYDRRVLGDHGVAELACVHPVTARGSTRFQLFACDGADLAVAGEVDAANAPRFAEALGRTCPPARDDRLDDDALVVDAGELRFIDHHGLLALEALGTPVRLHRAPRVARRLTDLLELRNVHPMVRP